MRELCSLDNDRGYLLLPQELLDSTFGLWVSWEQVFGKGLGYLVTLYPSADKTHKWCTIQQQVLHRVMPTKIQAK